MVRVLLSCCALGGLLLASGVAAQQALLVADVDTSAVAFRSQVGRVVTFVCPSTLNRFWQVWGSDVYHHESAICTAAVHAGALAAGTSAQVTIRMGPGVDALPGTERNGVTSLPYARTDATYTFVTNSETGQIDWHTSYARVPDDFHQPLTLLCPGSGNLDRFVIGTDVYRDDSAICVAAVHAGIITPAAGGRVTVTLVPKQETLTASTRNGVSSQQWSNWDYLSYPQPYSVRPGAITVTPPRAAVAIQSGSTTAGTSSAATLSRASTPAVASGPLVARREPPAAVTETSPAPPSQPVQPGPRRIRVSGFTAAGTAPLIVPRSIATPGFVAGGTAPTIVPRAISVSGWTGTGTAQN